MVCVALNAYYFNGVIDLVRKYCRLGFRRQLQKGNEVTIRNVPFAQYIKLEGDGRFYRRLGLYSSWANRIIVGMVYLMQILYRFRFIKQFFVGGNNSLRGFRSRSVGPGTYVIRVLPIFYPMKPVILNWN
jgi:outer membrane protein assembly factor BamA